MSDQGRAGLLAVAVALAAMFILAMWTFHRSPQVAVIGTQVETHGYFYRLKAAYLHGSERIDFDIVAGCGVRVTEYGDNSSSFDASRYPPVFLKETQDGGAILQYVTAACQGETTANGKAPKDLFPGAIWYDSKDDLSLGIGYLTEDAFDNPRSKLKFLGATIEPATPEDWRAFQSELSTNLIDAKALITLSPWPTEAEVRANMWGKAKLAEWTRSSLQCWAVARFKLVDPIARKVIEEYRPQSKPHYWSPGYPKLQELLDKLRPFLSLKVEGGTLRDYSGFAGDAYGFTTRRRSGRLVTIVEEKSKLPPVIFPLRAEDGVPWASPRVTDSSVIYRDVDYNGGLNRGFAYCYSLYDGRGSLGAILLPRYSTRDIVTRVGGEPIVVEGEAGGTPKGTPALFFEDDQYLLRTLFVRLN